MDITPIKEYLNRFNFKMFAVDFPQALFLMGD